MKFSILQKGEGSQFTICVCYLCETALNVGLDVLSDMPNCTEMQEEAGKVNNTKN
jgi:hypothetical protein